MESGYAGFGGDYGRNEGSVILQRTVRYLYLRFIRIRRDPPEVARGFAIGVFVGVSLFWGFHMVLAVALASLFKGSKLTAVFSTWVGNPLTFSLILFLEYKVGCWVLGIGPGHLKTLSMEAREILHASWNVLFPMTIGSLLLGFSAALPAYFISNSVVRKIQERRLRRRT